MEMSEEISCTALNFSILEGINCETSSYKNKYNTSKSNKMQRVPYSQILVRFSFCSRKAINIVFNPKMIVVYSHELHVNSMEVFTVLNTNYMSSKHKY